MREVVDATGTTVASRLSYDPWGKVTESGDVIGGALSDFAYTGHYYDRPTGLALAQYRGYDAGLGRWLNRDPLGLAGGLNLYGYVDNDPVNATDPLGLASAPTRQELTFIAELLGVGNTAALINERHAALEAAAHGDADGAECHAQNANERSLQAVGEVAALRMGGHTVYRSLKGDKVQYVGITNKYARRAAEHLRSARALEIAPLMKGLSHGDAKAVEQALIQIHGLEKNGGTLLNKINSIAASNPTYSDQLRRGYELLRTIGYE